MKLLNHFYMHAFLSYIHVILYRDMCIHIISVSVLLYKVFKDRIASFVAFFVYLPQLKTRPAIFKQEICRKLSAVKPFLQALVSFKNALFLLE